MDSFEITKILGAVFGTVLIALGLQSLAGALFSSPLPEKPGFAVQVAEATAGGEQGGMAGGTAGGEAPAAESLGARLAKADAKKGEAVAKACAACHDFTKGGPNKVGPNLYGVVGRPHASHEGFAYSEAMLAKKGEPWSYEILDAFIKSPKDVVPGTKMAFGGVKKDGERADLLAYLATLSDAPVAFPAP